LTSHRTVSLWISACALVRVGLALASPSQHTVPVPHYVVDPFWPKQLPHNWILGQIAGLAVDSHDHVWVLHRARSLTADELGATQTPPRSECCVPAPAVLELDAQGRLVGAWGGPGYVPDWPKNEHAIWVDREVRHQPTIAIPAFWGSLPVFRSTMRHTRYSLRTGI
jgi:hypothetical protein